MAPCRYEVEEATVRFDATYQFPPIYIPHRRPAQAQTASIVVKTAPAKTAYVEVTATLTDSDKSIDGLAVADAAVTVVATTVSVGATVVGTAVDVTAAGVKAVAGTDDEEDDADEAPRVEAGDAAPQAALHTAHQP